MKRVVHLIPYDGIGGVESAARSMAKLAPSEIEFQVNYIYRSAFAHSGLATFNPLFFFATARRILARSPDLLIVSLWRACIVGILAKLLRPRLRLVLFLHSPNDVHWLDRFLTRLMAKFAYQIWADSKETLTRRLPGSPTKRGRVISFVTHHIPAFEDRSVNPVFIFWGRIHPQKGLDRALNIFAAVRIAHPRARFMIIGPDGGDLERIQKLTNDMGVSDAVSFPGGMDFNGIVRQARFASFYLQTSLLEGMAMSVVEAMQLGLVPVVTPVGEIGNYARRGKNALIVQSDESVVNEILAVLSDNTRYMELRKNAVATWDREPLYAESVLLACTEILSRPFESSGRFS